MVAFININLSKMKMFFFSQKIGKKTFRIHVLALFHVLAVTKCQTVFKRPLEHQKSKVKRNLHKHL